MNKLIFIGTGAGDSGMLKQNINTSSLYFEVNGLKFVLDPGPGTIVNAKKYDIDLTKINGLIVTHPHPDHYADANCLIDALRGKKSFLIAGKKCLEESENYYPCINKFQQSIPEQTIAVEPGDKVKIGKVTFEAVKNNHLDCGLGIKINKIGYVGDGSLEGLEQYYQKMDLLIFNAYLPYGKKMPGIHTSVDEIIKFLKATKPKKAIIQHYSQEILNAGIEEQAKLIQEQSGIKTIAAKDGLVEKL